MDLGSGSLNLFCLVAIVFVTVLGLVASAITIVPEYRRVVVFRLGRALGVKGPGLVLLIPVIDRAIAVDMREQKFPVPGQVVLSQENIPLSINFDLYYKVIDPQLSAISVSNVGMSAAGIAATKLRARIARMRAVEALSQRERLGRDLREELDEFVAKWGVKLTNIEIREIIPPKDIQEALARQVSDERVQTVLQSPLAGSKGTTQTPVHTDGKVIIDGKSWDAVSRAPIPPASKIRVQRVILEIEQDSAD